MVGFIAPHPTCALGHKSSCVRGATHSKVLPVCAGTLLELTTCIDPALNAGAYLSSQTPAGNEPPVATGRLPKNSTVP